MRALDTFRSACFCPTSHAFELVMTCTPYDRPCRAISVARQGLSYGVHVMTSSNAWLVGQKQALLNVSNARIQLRLSNPDETQMGTGIDHRKAARHTLDRPGFGVSRQGHEILIGIP